MATLTLTNGPSHALPGDKRYRYHPPRRQDRPCDGPRYRLRFTILSLFVFFALSSVTHSFLPLGCLCHLNFVVPTSLPPASVRLGLSLGCVGCSGVPCLPRRRTLFTCILLFRFGSVRRIEHLEHYPRPLCGAVQRKQNQSGSQRHLDEIYAIAEKARIPLKKELALVHMLKDVQRRVEQNSKAFNDH